MIGIFGPRGPSYSYSPNNYLAPSYLPSYVTPSYGTPSYGNPTLNPYCKSTYGYPHYSQYPNASLYPSYPQSPNTCAYPSQLNNFTSYSWGTPEILLPSHGLESVLIGILILVVLDMVIVRPLKITS